MENNKFDWWGIPKLLSNKDYDFKAWFKERKLKLESRKKEAYIFIFIFGFIALFLIGARVNCEISNNGDYYNDKLFFYEGFGYKCMKVSDFDQEYYSGMIEACLSTNPMAKWRNCQIMPTSEKFRGVTNG